MIEWARYTADGSIDAEIDGVTYNVPDDMGNRHRQELAEWEAEGNTIEPYQEPEPQIPNILSSRQFFLQLDAAGLTLLVNAWVALQPSAVQIAYAKSAAFYRNDEMLQLGFSSLGFSTEQIDSFFTAASVL